MTGAEFVLLRVLGKSLNRIVSRVDLFKACKSGVYVKESRVVDTSISRLRLKFDSTDIGAKILSVRDAGYVLNFEAKAEPGIEPVPGLNANSDVGDLKGTTQKGRVVVKRFGSSEPTSRA